MAQKTSGTYAPSSLACLQNFFPAHTEHLADALYDSLKVEALCLQVIFSLKGFRRMGECRLNETSISKNAFNPLGVDLLSAKRLYTSGSEQKVEVVVEHRPRIALDPGILQKGAQAVEEVFLSGSSRNILWRLIPRAIICWRAPGASIRDLRGIPSRYQG
jgi:hypothetical protein